MQQSLLEAFGVSIGVHATQAEAGDGAVTCRIVRHGDFEAGQVAHTVDPGVAQAA